MGYYEFRISVPDQSKEAVVNKLDELGSTGFIEKESDIVAYFEDSCDVNELSRELSGFKEVLESSGLDPDFHFEYSLLEEKDWNEAWKASFSPIDVGERLTIIPSWLKHETGRIPLIIDPGMVFGTGYHESTRTCLELIERLAAVRAKGRFLDIGTGSGILAISAGLLGFSSVVAVDTDPMAIDAAERNVGANGLTNVEVKLGDISVVDGRFDLIAANLLSGILIGICKDIKDRLNPGGTAILSGMLGGQEEEVIAAFVAEGFVLRDKVVAGQWVSLVVEVS